MRAGVPIDGHAPAAMIELDRVQQLPAPHEGPRRPLPPSSWTGHGRRRRPTPAELGRLALASLLSLSLHALLLSLTFGDDDSGLPGLGFPWQERRGEAPGLRVELVPVRIEAAPPQPASFQQLLERTAPGRTVAARPTLTPSASSAPTPRAMAEANERVAAVRPGAPAAPPLTPRADEPPAIMHTEEAGETAPAPIPETVANAIQAPEVTRAVEPVAAQAPIPVIAHTPGASTAQGSAPALPSASDTAQPQHEPEAAEQAVDLPILDLPGPEPQRPAEALETAPVVAASHESGRAQPAAAPVQAQHQDAERQEAPRAEAARLEAERQQAARIETARPQVEREDERQRAAEHAAASAEAQRQEPARQEAARIEAARLEADREDAARTEAARLEAERREIARQEAARQEAAHIREEAEEDARREARRRAMARQLEEEAARREAASAVARTSSLPYSLSAARRVRLWGRAHPNLELLEYAEAWSRKIQLNTAAETVRDVAARRHTPPMVTVAVRSDGSVESVTFEVSSGAAEVDEAIRRIVEAQRPYPPFSPALAREFDVIEIRRTWYFDTAVRLN